MSKELSKEQRNIPPIPEGYTAIFAPASDISLERSPECTIYDSFWDDPLKAHYLMKDTIEIVCRGGITYLTNDFESNGFRELDVLILIKKREQQ